MKPQSIEVDAASLTQPAFLHAGELLGFNPHQTEQIVYHWHLAGLLSDEMHPKVLTNLNLSAARQAEFIQVVGNCRAADGFNAHRFCQAVGADEPQDAVIALALFEYLQQTHFSKPGKEVSLAVDSSYIDKYQQHV